MHDHFNMNALSKQRECFIQARDYIVYYGYGENDKLAEYDVAIVDPGGHTRSEIQQLQDNGTLVIAYVSVMEIAEYDQLFKWLKDEDFIQLNGKTIKNETYNTFLLDLYSKRWLGLLHHKIGSVLLGDGYDGIFLDTIGNVEWSALMAETSGQTQIKAAADLVKELRKCFPDHVILQNNGVEHLCRMTAGYIDGLCWENPPIGNKVNREWLTALLSQLNQLKQAYPLRTMILMEQSNIVDEQDIHWFRNWTGDHQLLLYIAPSQYITVQEKINNGE